MKMGYPRARIIRGLIMSYPAVTPVEILLVEDNEDDVFLTVQAFRKGKVRNNVHVAGDGVDALSFLRREGKHAQAPRPDIILLDLNLPRMNGHELLKQVKESKEFRSIPVIILTTSKADEDVAVAYQCHSNCFITKPVVMEEFEKVIRTIEDFWFMIVRLPPKSHDKQ